MHKPDLVFNQLQWLIGYKTKPDQTIIIHMHTYMHMLM